MAEIRPFRKAGSTGQGWLPLLCTKLTTHKPHSSTLHQSTNLQGDIASKTRKTGGKEGFWLTIGRLGAATLPTSKQVVAHNARTHACPSCDLLPNL